MIVLSNRHHRRLAGCNRHRQLGAYSMNYQITVWKLSGKTDEVESVFKCTTETHWQAIELFDCIICGIRGHYKAWLVDLVLDKQLRESFVTWQ